MIRYLHHSIRECKHIETGKIFYELLQWYIQTDYPEIAGNRSCGHYESYKEAEDKHNEMLVKGLLQDE